MKSVRCPFTNARGTPVADNTNNLFREMTLGQQRLFENTARVMGDAAAYIKQRRIEDCVRADPAYSASVAAVLCHPCDRKSNELVS
jgi:catalase